MLKFARVLSEGFSAAFADMVVSRACSTGVGMGEIERARRGRGLSGARMHVRTHARTGTEA